ncbi:MAG: SLBB domain-containing protein [Candidatus Marinimicrobia bacterium]|nr:SLBB domain-containing protein [Candidatus Neomarinimicrobiota bacterium]MCF7828793.1 SLBB domain-containing protein [Candidatus Neomarinimicrobiota bacterium]MCF7880710.1 SLBB domain-containing protein [Candidatus Neomarinimicrobiota bacterium]
MISGVLPYVFLLTMGIFLLPVAVHQQVPGQVQEELERQGMTIEEARQRARQLGIDLSNPQQATQRARELGIPESRIQQMLDAYQSASPEQRQSQQDMFFRDDTTVWEDTTALADTTAMAQDTTKDTTRRAVDSLPYFGYNLFKKVPDAFKPTATGPVDDGYLVGPQDELRLVVWGSAEFQYDLPVDKEGRIYIPNVGQFTVAGKQLSTLREEIRQWLSRSYAGLTANPPTAYMDLTVTRLRPIKVYVLGEVKQPGGYTISSNSTVFNVLYSVGGPLRQGSLRQISVIRDGKVAATVDMYGYLLNGYEPSDLRLQNNDRVFVPPRGKTVAVRGQVKRPAYYEMLADETFKDLVDYAGGLTAEAYAGRFHVTRIIPLAERENPSVAREVLDFSLTKVLSGEKDVSLADGDHVSIFSILKSYQNRVFVSGAVYQPGQYELSDSVRTIRQLILRADSVRPDAYLEKADLIRVNRDSTERQISLNLNLAFEDHPRHNLPLLPDDSLRVYSRTDLDTIRQVAISGQVRNPGVFTLRDSMTVYDLLFRGEGLLDEEYLKTVYLPRADLFRQTPDGRREIVVPFNLEEALNGDGLAEERLQPHDEIRVYPRKVEERVSEKFVNISGSVKNPGQYRLQENMTLEDLIFRAGGFTEDSYLEQVEISRLLEPEAQDAQSRAKTLTIQLLPEVMRDSTISFGIDDTTLALSNARTFSMHHRDRVYVRRDPNFKPQKVVTVSGEVQYPGDYTLREENELLSQVLRRAGGLRTTAYPKGGRLVRKGQNVITRIDRALEGEERADVILQPGDEVIIPPQPNTVSVQGNVANPGLIKFEEGRRLWFYLDRAGGVGDRVEHVYITQASGATFEVDPRWYWLDPNPKVDDGAIIRVTEAPEREREPFNLGQTLTDISQIISTTLTILVLASRL